MSGTLGIGGRGLRQRSSAARRGTDWGGGQGPPSCRPRSARLHLRARRAGDASRATRGTDAGRGQRMRAAAPGRRPADGAPAGAATGMRPAAEAPAGAASAARRAARAPARRAGYEARPVASARDVEIGSRGAGAGRRGLDTRGARGRARRRRRRRRLDAGASPRADGGGSVSSRFRRMRGFAPAAARRRARVRSPSRAHRTDGGGVFGSISSSTSRRPATANDVPGVVSTICARAGAARTAAAESCRRSPCRSRDRRVGLLEAVQSSSRSSKSSMSMSIEMSRVGPARAPSPKRAFALRT